MLQMGGVPLGEPEFGVEQHSPHQGGEGDEAGLGAAWRPLKLRDHLVTLSTYVGPRWILQLVNCCSGKKKSLCFYEPPVQRNVTPDVLTLYRPEITLLFSFMGGSSSQGQGNRHGSVSAALRS